MSTRRRVVATTLTALALAVASANDASAASLPILHGSTTGPGQEAHQCTVIGNDGTTEGVVCIDILTGLSDSSSGAGDYAKDQVEAYCQHMATGADVQCANAMATLGLYNGAGQGNSSTFECGHSHGPCSTGRNYWTNTDFNYPWSSWSDANCALSVTEPTQVWAVAFGDNDTVIELPGSDKNVELSTASSNDSGNESTGHYFICP